ncbi:hypothetical protein Tco_0700080 [Tanacetum coccineum]
MGLLIVLEKAGKFLCISTGDARGVWYSLLQSQPIGLKLQDWKIPHHHARDSNNPSAVVSRLIEVALIMSQKMDHEIYEVAASIQPEIV